MKAQFKRRQRQVWTYFIPLLLQMPMEPTPAPPFSSGTSIPPEIFENKELPRTLPTPERNQPDRFFDILDFWFGHLPNPEFFPQSKVTIWSSATPEIDRQIRERFSQDILNAAKGEYNDWRETPRGRLALILLLDQFPRHLYRNQPQAFMTDSMARALAFEGIQKGDDKKLYPIERAFFYLPLEHAESPSTQEMAVVSYRQLWAQSPKTIKPVIADFLKHAQMQQKQIARFGRFPYRNAILGRSSTPEEEVFLRQWGKRLE